MGNIDAYTHIHRWPSAFVLNAEWKGAREAHILFAQGEESGEIAMHNNCCALRYSPTCPEKGTDGWPGRQ